MIAVGAGFTRFMAHRTARRYSPWIRRGDQIVEVNRLLAVGAVKGIFRLKPRRRGQGTNRLLRIAVQSRDAGDDGPAGVFGFGNADRGVEIKQQLLRSTLAIVPDFDRAKIGRGGLQRCGRIA